MQERAVEALIAAETGVKTKVGAYDHLKKGGKGDNAGPSPELKIDPSTLEQLRVRRVVKKKGDIAALCEEIMEDPNVHLMGSKDHPKGWSKVAQLFDLVRNDPDAEKVLRLENKVQ